MRNRMTCSFCGDFADLSMPDGHRNAGQAACGECYSELVHDHMPGPAITRQKLQCARTGGLHNFDEEASAWQENAIRELEAIND